MAIKKPTRRAALLGMAATIGTPQILRATTTLDGGLMVDRNISAFTMQDWRNHFDELGVGCILADISSRALHYWDAEGAHMLFPSSVPRSDEMTRRGYTKVVRKTEFPSWTPTAAMRARDPDLPKHVAGGDPSNPLGSRAMYLSWPSYLIHGTHDTRKIGRMSSSGCIGLYNADVEKLYPKVIIGTQVRVL